MTTVSFAGDYFLGIDSNDDQGFARFSVFHDSTTRTNANSLMTVTESSYFRLGDGSESNSAFQINWSSQQISMRGGLWSLHSDDGDLLLAADEKVLLGAYVGSTAKPTLALNANDITVGPLLAPALEVDWSLETIALHDGTWRIRSEDGWLSLEAATDVVLAAHVNGSDVPTLVLGSSQMNLGPTATKPFKIDWTNRKILLEEGDWLIEQTVSQSELTLKTPGTLGKVTLDAAAVDCVTKGLSVVPPLNDDTSLQVQGPTVTYDYLRVRRDTSPPSQLRLQDTDDVVWDLWVTTSGQLRIADSPPTELNQATHGDPV